MKSVKLNDYPLFILADPGARAHFVASWLLSDLTSAHYEIGTSIKSNFTKWHNDWDNIHARNFNGVKIRIKPSFSLLSLHLYHFLIKNVYVLIPDLPQDPYKVIITDKLLESAKGWWYHDLQIDYSLYDKCINFNDTYSTDFMVDLFFWYNNKYPTIEQIKILEETNKLNYPTFDKNHAASIAAMVIEQEFKKELKEIDRYWSIEKIYRTTDPENLYETIYNSIVPENYGVSGSHGLGINNGLEERKNHI